MTTATTPLRSALALSILVLSGCNVVSVDDEQHANAVATEDSEVSEVERPKKPLGPERHEYESAYGSLQKAVSADDREATSRLVSYPLTVSRGAVHQTIATPAQFIAEYDSIVTPSVRQVIVEHSFSDVVNDRYDRSHDVNLLVAGALLGAVTESVARNWGSRYSVSNNYYYQGYANYYNDGCHGIGCLVDPPPPVDTYDGYTGCHGDGCLVDSPDATPGYIAMEPMATDGVPEPGQTAFSARQDVAEDPPEPGQTRFSEDSNDPLEPGRTKFSDGSDGGSDEPPEPRQDGDSNDAPDDRPETRQSDEPDDASDDTPEPELSDDSDNSDDASDDVHEPERSDDSDDATDDLPETDLSDDADGN